MPALRTLGVLASAGLALALACADAPPANLLGPVPFRIDIRRLYLKFKSATVFDDTFDVPGRFGPVFKHSGKNAGYLCSMGTIGGAAIGNGALTISEANTVNPYGPFAAKLLLPVDAVGRVTFSAAESFGDFELGTTLHAPRLPPGTRFNIGIGDVETLALLGAISLENGAILLERSGRSAWDTIPLQRIAAPELASAEEVSLVFGVNAQGHIHGTAHILNGGKPREIDLDPADPRATIRSDRANLSANLFVETLPKPYVLSVFPRDVNASDLRELKGLLALKIVGIGFSALTEAELSAVDGHAQALEAIRLTGPTSFSGTARLPPVAPARYSLKVRTGDQVFVLENAIRVY